MPSFPSDSVHGLSADVYFGPTNSGVARRVFGDVQLAVALQKLDLTANDEGNVNPVQVLRRGEVVTVTCPFADATGFALITGVVQPFSTTVTGVSGLEIILPKAQPGDDFLSEAQELRLVLRDGSATWIFPKAVVTEIGDLVMSEENQMVQPCTFTCFRVSISGSESPFKIISGSVVSGAGV